MKTQFSAGYAAQLSERNRKWTDVILIAPDLRRKLRLCGGSTEQKAATFFYPAKFLNFDYGEQEINESTIFAFQGIILGLHESGAIDDRAVRNLVDGLRNQSGLFGDHNDETISADLERLGSAIEEGLKA